MSDDWDKLFGKPWTFTPWYLKERGVGASVHIFNERGVLVAVCMELETAKIIVNAVNSPTEPEHGGTFP